MKQTKYQLEKSADKEIGSAGKEGVFTILGYYRGLKKLQ